MNARRILSTSAVATAAVLLSIGVQTLAYTAPTAAPTGNDADAPLNVGSAAQTKAGALTLTGALSADGGIQSSTITTTGNIQSQGRITADVGAGEGFCLGTSCITAWPAAVDTSTFLNTSATAQTKAGPLTVQGGFTASGLVANTSSKVIVGGGSASPNSDVPLTVNGRVRITGGSGVAPTTDAFLIAGGPGGDTGWTPSRCGTAGAGSSCVRFPGGAMITWGITSTGTGDRTQSFPSGVSFSNTNYAVNLTPNGSTSQNCVPAIKTKNATSFVFRTDGSCNDVTYNWQATGF